MYLEKAQSPGSVAPIVLYSIPGFESVSAATTGFGRANVFIGGRQFMVVGADLIEVNQLGVQTVRGTVAVDGNPATICGNGDGGNQLFVTSGGNGYVYDLVGNTLSAIAALAGIAVMGKQIDGYFLSLDSATSTIYISDLNDGTTWDPSNFIQRSQAPDPWVSIAVSNKYLYFIGSQTGEAWYNAGTFPIPFVPASAGLFNYGTPSPFSPKRVGDSLCFVGQTINGTGLVLQARGLRPEVISTDALTHALGHYSTLTDGIGDCHSVAGHTFYTITFPEQNATWAWDESFPSWCERGSWDSMTGMYNAWRPIHHAFAFGEARFLDLIGSSLYRMDETLATDIDGDGIRWQRTGPSIVQENKPIFFGTFELLAETGIGLSSGQGSDPQVMMQLSKDGGRTWGSEIWRSMGLLGEYSKRIRWTRCGTGRKKTVRIAGSDPVRVMLAGGYFDSMMAGI